MLRMGGEKMNGYREGSSGIFEFQQILIEDSTDGIMACDENRRTIIFNRRMEKILGYAKEEVAGKLLFTQFFSPKDAEKFERSLYSEEFGGKNRLFLYETTLVNKSGIRVPVQLSASVLFQDGKEIGIAGFFRDRKEIMELSQRYADRTQLLHQDKMVSLGELAASVVHEINNPLAGMLNYSRLMLKILGRGPLASESQKKFIEYLTLMENQLNRCSGIVIDLLAFSRRSKQEFKEVDMNDVVKKSVDLSNHRLYLQNIQPRLHLQDDMPRILGDFSQLQQCMINLIFNAIDAMPKGGVLTIRTFLDDTAKVITVQVEDTGCGISKEDLAYIFDTFFTTKKEGLGLGLSTVRSIVERHGGRISVKSEAERGTTFTVNFGVSGTAYEPMKAVR